MKSTEYQERSTNMNRRKVEENKQWCKTRPIECDGTCCNTRKKKRGK